MPPSLSRPQLPPQSQHQQNQNNPAWTLENSGSFASIHVQVPPGTSINCESDAVVTFSQGIEVRGVLSGGLLAGLARAFFTRESFFTTSVQNTSREAPGDVMMAPSKPGGIVLHRLDGGAGDGDDMLLTKGSYVASDVSVKMTSEVQRRIGNSLLSGTGFFLLRAQGRGYVACGAYGAVHKCILKRGEVRAVDNGHLVAWTASMRYNVGLASTGGSSSGRIMNSMSSGEGLMCFFEGPGIIYLQSHKVDESSSNGQSRGRKNPQILTLPVCIIICVVFLCFWSVVAAMIYSINKHNATSINLDSSRGGHSQSHYNSRSKYEINGGNGYNSHRNEH
eukprot:CAMPEP_0172489240 /NCGR_PEP_ID=MMETSP1066-20121228/19110_1 /TAXON_ID=671091 /ORGANISM="Coscinodiscus wailesii, Strain CCMP2513" /LENGTH=334 /DNA_ID=CAMNT_0013256953 /DNA_START=66 /DNA_END=1070 /DNA_ORIENTATION=+